MAQAKKKDEADSGPGTSLVSWKEELKKQAAMAVAVEKNSGGLAYISTKAGQFTLDGNSTEDGLLEMVVLDHVLENHFYIGPYDPDERQSPVCFAFGTDESEMRPHESSSQPQNEDCATCPMNKYGTADKGAGKACKNVRRLGVLMAEDASSSAAVADARVAFLKVPVTSAKQWTGHVRKLASSYELPPLGVVTEAKLKAHKKNQWEMTFRVLEHIEDGSVIESLLLRKSGIQEELRAPYSPPEEAEEEKPRGKVGGKAVAKTAAKPAAKPAVKGRR